MTSTLSSRWGWAVRGAALAAVVGALFFAYRPALTGGFIWDDDAWTTKLAEQGLFANAAGLGRMWTSLTAAQQYYPLTATTFWLDDRLWHFWTVPYHVENLLLHAAAAGLFWRLLRKLEVPGAGWAAAIFALHPLMAQSVAWITERKNVLSLVLYLGALLAYGRFDGEGERPQEAASAGPGRRWGQYGLALLLFAAALLAKTTTVSLPAAILLIVWWRRGTIRLVEDVGPTLPFFALAGALGRVTAWVEAKHVIAQGPEWALTWPERCVIAGRAFWFYAGKLAWPVDLAFVYPRWPVEAGSVAAWIAPGAAVALLVGLWLGRRTWGRGPFAAAGFFAGTLFPVLGFFNGYFMRFSFVWDHLAYLPSLGPIALAAAGGSRAAGALRAPRSAIGLAALALAGLAWLTWRESATYRDLPTLWEATLAADPLSPLANKNYADWLRDHGRREEAIFHYRRAGERGPGLAEAHYDLGNELVRDGALAEAVGQYREALALSPRYAPTHNNLGIALTQQGRYEEAIAEFQRAVALEPRYAVAEDNLGLTLLRTGDRVGARAHFRIAVELQPGFAEANYNLGKLLREDGQTGEALGYLKASLRIQPHDPKAEDELGLALCAAGQVAEAVVHFERAVHGSPASPEAQNNLANALASTGRVDEAIVHYHAALKLRPDFPEASHNLALALALARH